MSLASTYLNDGRTEGRTDARTDGRTIVGGVLAQKWLSSNCEKSDKNWSEGYIQMSCTFSVLDKNNSKVSKGLG